MKYYSHANCAAVLLVMLVAACGGGGSNQGDVSTSPNTLAPAATRLERTTVTGAKPIFHEASQTVTSSNNPEAVATLAADQGVFADTVFKRYAGEYVRNVGGATIRYPIDAIYGTTSTGAGNAVIFSVSPIVGGYNGFERLTPTELPTSGTAVYSGDYAGQFSAINGFKDASYVTGSVTLEANFVNLVVNGSITDRQDSTGVQLTDVVLEQGNIVDGEFLGTVNGGLVDAPNFAKPFDTVYEGMFVGGNGQEVVGGLTIRHENTLLDEFGDEVGLFILNQSASVP